jgi:hypothetical protein
VRAVIAEGEAHLSMDEPYLGIRWLNGADNARASGCDRADWVLVYLPRLRAALSGSTGV